MDIYQVGLHYQPIDQLLFCICRYSDVGTTKNVGSWGANDGGWTHLIYKGIL